MSKSTYSSLSEWVLQTSLEHLFIPKEKLESGFIKQVYYIKNKALNVNCLMFVVSDRFYSIPVLVEEAKALKEFGISNLGEMEIQNLYNHIITFKKSAMAVYSHQSALYPYIIAVDWSSPNRKISYKANSQPVYNNPKLQPWIQSLKHVTIPNQSLPSVCFSVKTINVLFPHFHLFEPIAQKFFRESHLPAEAVNHVAQTSSKSGLPSTPATLNKPVATLKLNQAQPDTRPSATPTSNSVNIQKEPLNKKKDKCVIRPAVKEKVQKSTSASSRDKTNAKKSTKKSTDIVKKTAALVNSLAPELLDKSKDTATKLVKKAKVKSKTTTTTTKHTSASSSNTSTATPVVSIEGPKQPPAQKKVKTDAFKSTNLCAVPTFTPSIQPGSYLYPQNDTAMADPQEDHKALIEKSSLFSTPDLSISISSNTRDPLIKSESSSPSLKHFLLYPTAEPAVAANTTTVTPTTTVEAKAATAASSSVTAVVEAAAALLKAVEATAITYENQPKAIVSTNEKKSAKSTSSKGKSSKATSTNKPPPASTNKPSPTSTNKPPPTSTNKNKSKPASTSTNKNNLPPADTSSNKPSSTSTNKNKPQTTGTNKDKPLSIGANKDKPLSTGTNKDKPLPVGTNKGKPLPTGTNKIKPLPTGTNKIKPPASSSQPPDPKPAIKKPTGLTSILDTTNFAIGMKRPPHSATSSIKKAKLVNTSTFPTPSSSTRVNLADNSDLIEVFSLVDKTPKVRRSKKTTPTTVSKSKSSVIETASLTKVLPQQLNASMITDLHQTVKETLSSEDTRQRKRMQQSVPQEKIPKKIKISPPQAEEDQHIQKAKEDQLVQDMVEKIHAEDSSSLCRFDRLSQLRNRTY